jgi:hypothetical protein
MESREIKVWNPSWNMEVTEYVRSIDGVDLADAHVELLKNDLYSAISDASKDANGFRMRYDISDMTVAELEELCSYWFEQASAAAREEEAAMARAEAKFEETVANLIECGAGDRATAVRWIREANAHEDHWGQDEDYIKYSLGVSYRYDLDHGDHNYYERKAAAEAA